MSGTRWQWALRRLSRQIWVPVTAYGLLGVASALAALLVKPLIPADVAVKIGADSADALLGIIASSMLAVTTFSVSIMIAVYAAAAGGATPRATQLLIEDRTAQRVLATFIGAFIFALVGIIALRIGIYGDSGRLVLFSVTVLVLVMIVASLLRWISHLARFGRLSDTIARVETAAATSLAERSASPLLGGRDWGAGPPSGARPIRHDSIGYVEHLDMPGLQGLAEALGAQIWIDRLPGAFLHPGDAFCHLVAEAAPDQQAIDRLREACSVGPQRSFDQDPRFGLIALAEIASRALSPAVNDPGTAIDVIGRMVRVLALWQPSQQPEVVHDRLHVRGLDVAEMLSDGFRPIARDGAGLVEVQIRLHKGLDALARWAPGIYDAPARDQAREALERAGDALTSADLAALRAALLDLDQGGAAPPVPQPRGH